MRTEQILYLSEIHQTSSLHRASEKLHISVQSLSLSINALEKEFNVALVTRSRRGSVLTTEGLQLLDAGMIFLQAIDAIKGNHLDRYPHLHRACIELLITNGMMTTYFPSLVAQFYADFPHSQIKTQKASSDVIFERLLNGAPQQVALIQYVYIDQKPFGVSYSDVLDMQTVLSGKFFCLSHARQPISRYNTISLKTMSKHPCLVYSPSRNVLDALLNFSGDTKKAIYLDDYSVFSQMIHSGAGNSFISVIDNNDFLPEPPQKLIPFKEKIQFSVNFVYRKNSSLSPVMQEFIAYAKEYYLNHAKFLAIKH